MKTIKAKVYRLPTDGLSSITQGKGEYSHLLHYNPEDKFVEDEDEYPIHLYITTDEEIKEGDWFLHPKYEKGIKTGLEVIKADSSYFGGYGYDWHFCKKIIATTDPKLHTNEIVEEDMHMYKKSLPQIPKSFIEEYCEAGGIDEVLVEYHPKGCSYGNIILDDLNGDGSYYGDNNKYEVEISRSRKEVESYGAKFHDSLLKLDNNCIIIHPVEEKMYSREEFETKLKEAFHIGYENCQYNHSLTVTARKVDLDKWIEENL